MDKSAVFLKTDDGRVALTSRPPGLTPRLRSLLIMTDGKRTVAELDKMLGADGAASPLLEQLVAQGWVHGQGAPGAAPNSEVPGAPAEGNPGSVDTLPPLAKEVWPFIDARRRVGRFINDQLGPMGETLAIRVESCKTAADLHAALPRIRDGLRNFKSSATVQQFDQEIAIHLPPS